MNKLFNFKDKSFIVYGLGLTGQSVVKFLKRNKAKSVFVWDDKFKNSKVKNNIFKKKIFSNDHIVLSPGVNINNTKFKKSLLINKNKFLSDIDLFFLKNNIKNSIVITGTNGKSTTCSLINYVLKRNNIGSKLVGNIGTPILDIKYNKRDIYVIEASSFQLEYSKHLRPYCAAILNITDDHLDWHGSKQKYIKSKFKIFNNQTKNDIAFLENGNLKKIYKKKKLSGKLKLVKKNLINLKNINNSYLKLRTNKENINFAYSILKLFKIKKNKFLKTLTSFKGLPHRQEKFLKVKNYTFINDSKATSFESAKYALNSYENIIWILGGQPKKNEKFFINKYKKKIIKAYVVGKNPQYFVKKLKNLIDYEVNLNLKNVVRKILKSRHNKKITVLFSPASASYDQYNNFVERGEKFKNIVKIYAK